MAVGRVHELLGEPGRRLAVAAGMALGVWVAGVTQLTTNHHPATSVLAGIVVGSAFAVFAARGRESRRKVASVVLALVLFVALPFFVVDRLAEAFGESWWTAGARFLAIAGFIGHCRDI